MFKFYAFQLWEWLVVHGIPLAALVIIAVLIPRVGRLAIRIVSGRFDEGEEATKSRLALVGALVYVLQAIAYFAIIMLGLTNLGVPAMGAALPATVVSAAIGFGAQNVIGDFLAGFFIISERQFGVGDFVSFDGTSSNISGTVVGLTLRATKVRTASGEVVTIPNGSAGVITNFSQDWSRAVVDLAVPLQADESMSQLTDRVEIDGGKGPVRSVDLQRRHRRAGGAARHGYRRSDGGGAVVAGELPRDGRGEPGAPVGCGARSTLGVGKRFLGSLRNAAGLSR